MSTIPQALPRTDAEAEAGLLEHYQFETTEARDAALDEFWPARTCSDVPGTYFLPDGRILSVFLETVQVWRA